MQEAANPSRPTCDTFLASARGAAGAGVRLPPPTAHRAHTHGIRGGGGGSGSRRGGIKYGLKKHCGVKNTGIALKNTSASEHGWLKTRCVQEHEQIKEQVAKDMCRNRAEDSGRKKQTLPQTQTFCQHFQKRSTYNAKIKRECKKTR